MFQLIDDTSKICGRRSQIPFRVECPTGEGVSQYPRLMGAKEEKAEQEASRD